MVTTITLLPRGPGFLTTSILWSGEAANLYNVLCQVESREFKYTALNKLSLVKLEHLTSIVEVDD